MPATPDASQPPNPPVPTAGSHPIRRCLISVYDKTGIVDFARALHDEFGIEIISTGGTARTLRDAGIPVTLIEDITGYPEMLDGRVKTLHPAIHAGILADRDNPEHMRQLAAHGIKPIDMVVVSLYPFEKTVADPNCTFEQAIEMIDIGGVTLLRAAAKNSKHVLVITSSVIFETVLLLWRRKDPSAPSALLAAASFHAGGALDAFFKTARYDAAIAEWLSAVPDTWPRELAIWAADWGPMRYGENPHQASSLLSLHSAKVCNLVFAGSQDDVDEQTRMSHNNYLDADAALGLCAELARAKHDNKLISESHACVFIKHTNACGAAVHADPVEAYRNAYLGDPNAAMGGILAVDFDVDAGFAAVVMETYARFGKPLKDAGAAYAPGGFFVEVWIAPRFTDDAVAVIRGTYDAATAKPEPGEPRLGVDGAQSGSDPARAGTGGAAPAPKKDWGQRVRLLAVGDMTVEPDPDARVYRSIAGGMLVQTPDTLGLNEDQWKVVTNRAPTEAEMDDLRLAWLVCKHTKSNAITICRDGMLLGNGAGQMSRVMSCRIATWLARENGHVALGMLEELGDRPPAGLSPRREITDELQSRRHLPHIERQGVTQYVTFRLREGQLSPSERDMVLDACRHWHGDKMTLHAVSVMPDHVHMILTPIEAATERWVPLAEIMKSIKSFSASQVNRARGRKGSLWLDETFDRIIRDERDYREKMEYVLQNPVTAGLVENAEDYRWIWHSEVGWGEWILKAKAGKDRPEAGPPTPVAASDAFFPFPDGPRVLIDAGITALIQPGGGKRDQETIDLCNARGVAMIFTGTRHFRH